MLLRSRVWLLMLLIPAVSQAEDPAGESASSGETPAVEQVRVERVEPAPQHEDWYYEVLERYQNRMAEFQGDIRDYVAWSQEDRKAQIDESYGRVIGSLVEEEDSLRILAKARFESFLEKYPDADYTPHVMFRLADLYFEEAENKWLEEYAAYTEMEQSLSFEELDQLPPPPKKDYTRPLDLYEQILARYPAYERIDGVYYMVGFCYSERNAEQYAEERGHDALMELVNRFPESEFANDANMRLGEYYFDNNDTEAAIPYYRAIVESGEDARYYDKGLYKLAWSHYKQADMEEFYEYGEALRLFTELMDYSRRLRVAEGRKSAVESEAIQYMAISFADMADIQREPPTDVAERFFDQAGEREYEVDIMKKLAEVLTQQARWHEAIATYRYIQKRWPLDPENPEFQYRIAQLYMNLPVKDEESSAEAQMELARRYHDESDWWAANRNNPDALAVAKGYIEKSLAQVAVDYHIQAQASGNPADYAAAADKYREYLQKFPFADDYYEKEWYLADALFNAKMLEEAEAEYLQLLKTENHDFQDGSLFRLMQVRQQILVDRYGRVEARPEDPIVERTYTTEAGEELSVYMLTDEHQAFIETCDALVEAEMSDPRFAESRDKDLPALHYLPAQILYEFGHFEKARERFFEIIERFPRHDEAAFSAGLVVRSYQDEGNLQKVRLYTGKYARMRLGESEEAIGRTEQFASLEEGAAFKLAYNLIGEGRREEAAIAFLEFMEEFPQSEHIKDAHFNAANSFEIIGRADRANALFEEYINKYPTDERSEGLYFRIATNYASILQLDKAIRYYSDLVRNFPDAEDAPSALFNSAFLRIGIGDHAGAAEAFEEYATRYPEQADAEVAFFTAGDQWEQVSPDAAHDFYLRYLRRYSGVNADHTLEAQYRIIKILEEKGRMRQAERQWEHLTELFMELAQEGPIGTLGRRYAAEAEFRGLWERFQAYTDVKFTGDQEKDALLLVEEKPAKLKELERDCLALIQRYQDFTYSSAAIYVQAAAYFAYADMLFDAPPPEGFTQEQIDFYRTQLDDLRFPVEDKGKARALANLQKARDEDAWSEWQSRTLVLLNKRFPTEYPREKLEERYTIEAWISPEMGPISIELPGGEEEQDGAEAEGGAEAAGETGTGGDGGSSPEGGQP